MATGLALSNSRHTSVHASVKPTSSIQSSRKSSVGGQLLEEQDEVLVVSSRNHKSSVHDEAAVSSRHASVHEDLAVSTRHVSVHDDIGNASSRQLSVRDEVLMSSR